MHTIVLLDAGPLGLVTNPKATPAALACNLWLEQLLARQIQVIVPAIADYEVRRELLRARKTRGIERLNALAAVLYYMPISTEIMMRAAQLWAEARQQGRPTADPAALDADVILAASALLLGGSTLYDVPGERWTEETRTIVATTNVGHLGRFVDAQRWEEIDPEALEPWRPPI